MKYLHGFLGFISAVCLVMVLLISSVDLIIYGLPNFFEHEYTKYNVTETVDMTLDDLLHVTDEMMSYLRGNRKDLHVDTVVGGINREFFNEREIAHMEDVKDLFLGGVALRRISITIIVVCIAILLFTKSNLKILLPKSVFQAFGFFILVLSGLGIYMATDFTRAFIQFHHIFFSNDLWILDPRTDLLINIVPEPFFMDTAKYIGITFGTSLIIVLILAIIFYKKGKIPVTVKP